MKPRHFFDLVPGRVIAKNYRVEGLLGRGYEGEVYLVSERLTGARRAAKIFYPERNEKNAAATHYAQKLERLRDCSMVIQYHHAEQIQLQGEPVSVLISEFVEGQLLPGLLSGYRARRMPVHEALCLLRTIAAGLAEIHEKREYHGDLHAQNVLVRRRGVHFDVKLVDMYDRGRANRFHIQQDVCDVVRILYDLVGGKAYYASQPPVIKQICLGLKCTLITQRYPTAWHLCRHLDTFQW
ncbi:MAG: serine/threonine protein kinase [Phycisphaerae bacterium]|nr:serine/threonine protein kinase [Phycisphaerae bacterium]MBM91875.1 serine/threonine protein kinase [Phycisphaerae bacterium]HCT46223.1 serine/threonine protein kinase [Phycisphaerales bacterium]